MANSNTNDILKELEGLYLKAEYAEMRDLLIKNKAEISPEVFHYNLGTVNAKQGELAAARYNFEVAKKLGFEHPALSKNLAIVSSQVSEVTSEQSHLSNLTKLTVENSVSSFVALTLVFIVIIALLRRFKVISNYLVVAILVLIACTPLVYKTVYIDKKYKAAINLKQLKVHEGPSDIYPVVRELKSGQKLIIGKRFEEWIMIEAPINWIGWVKRSDLGIL